MATMVAISSALSSSIFTQEKGSRNKRKHRAEPPLSDPYMSESVFPTYEPSMMGPSVMEEQANMRYLEHHLSVCDACRDIIFGANGEVNFLEDFQETEWSSMTESKLEELILSNLDTIYRNAIKRITSYGYTEVVAVNAILTTGHCYGCKDPVGYVAEHALQYLASGQAVDMSERENADEELKKLEKSVLEDMVNVLGTRRPFLSTGDTMWCFLICGMDVSHACAIDFDPFGSVAGDEALNGAAASPSKPESNSNISSSLVLPEVNVPGPRAMNASMPYSQGASQSEISTMGGISGLPSGSFTALSNTQGPNCNPAAMKESLVSSADDVAEKLSFLTLSPDTQPSLSKGKFTDDRKGHIGSSKRESTNQRKSNHSYRAHRSRSAFRASKHNSLSRLLLDKQSKPISNSGINSKSSSLQLNLAQNFSFSAGSSASSSLSMKTASSNSLALANVDTCSSPPSISSREARPKPYGVVEPNKFAGMPYDRIGEKWVPHDQKDEMLLKLFPRVQELKVQLQNWTDWAQQKVMQAACRLNKDKAELQTLRQEKTEMDRLQKEKETLEESSMRKVAEMESAWAKACAQLEKYNATMNRLKTENTKLKHEFEAAKSRSAESAARCQDASLREIMTLKKIQSWEREKALSQNELAAEKRKLAQLQQQLKQAKEYQGQSEARLRQEAKLKKEALAQADAERTERKQIEASAKSEEDSIVAKAEGDMKRHKDSAKRLEQQIAKLKLTTGCSGSAVLRWDDITHFDFNKFLFEESDNADVQRDRECVMCLSEETSVVFLPCLHQAVCKKCNELHEKQGLKDCPSCRTPIQQRICVRSAYS